MRVTVIVMLLGALVLDVVYWVLWFTDRGLIASEHSRAYYEFENAFPLADGWLGIACLLALVGFVKGWPSALFWLIAAGASGLYLGCMDLLYDLENGIFAKGSAGAFEAVIVLATFVFSLTLLSWSWRHRAELLAGSDGRIADSPGRRTGP